VATPTGIDSFATPVTGDFIVEWKAKHLYADGGSPDGPHRPLDTPDAAKALQELSALVEPLIERTTEGDILVFCPSGALHGVPLHAAMFANDSAEKCLLERNPIVYTASMTTFEQCVTKETERGQLRRQRDVDPSAIPQREAVTKAVTTMTRSYMAVYERTETAALDPGQKRLRDEIYASVSQVADRRKPGCTTAFGHEAGRDRLVSALSEADYVYFFGHCESPDPANMLLQGLVLDDGRDVDENSSDDNTQDANAKMDTEIETETGHLFTASDIFSIDVNTSCVTLLACASAEESHSGSHRGEPLGIVSALLCAGATSVIGSMWKVQVDAARVFTDVLDINLNMPSRGKSKRGGGGGGRNTGAGILDLAVAVQRTAIRLKKRPEDQMHHPYHWAAFVLHGSWFMARRG